MNILKRNDIPSIAKNTNCNHVTGTTTISETDDEAVFYRTNDGSHDFKFWFKNCGNNAWRAYIMSKIDYCGRSENPHTIHRLHDSDLNLNYVCWTDILKSKAACKSVAAFWADCTVRYIKEGKSFG